MEFLLRALRKNRRRLRFEQWLLLAVRCLVIAFLGLALARPMGCQDTALASLAGQRAGLHVIVIDNSYSMAYEADRPDAKTNLDQAKLMAKRLIDRLTAGGESVAIITAARPATAIIAQPAYDLNAAKRTIDHIEQSYSDTDLLGALQKWRWRSGGRVASQPSKRLYLFTDATRSALDTPQADATAALSKELAKMYEIVHFNLSRPGQWNHAVIQLKAGEAIWCAAASPTISRRRFAALAAAPVLSCSGSSTTSSSPAAARSVRRSTPRRRRSRNRKSKKAART